MDEYPCGHCAFNKPPAAFQAEEGLALWEYLKNQHVYKDMVITRES